MFVQYPLFTSCNVCKFLINVITIKSHWYIMPFDVVHQLQYIVKHRLFAHEVGRILCYEQGIFLNKLIGEVIALPCIAKLEVYDVVRIAIGVNVAVLLVSVVHYSLSLISLVIACANSLSCIVFSMMDGLGVYFTGTRVYYDIIVD